MRWLSFLGAFTFFALFASACASPLYQPPNGGGGAVAPPDARVLSATASDGAPVRSVLFGRGSDTLLVHFHGNSGVAEGASDLARVFAAAGIDVLLVEYRGYGGSSDAGTPNEAGLYADAEAALASAPEHRRVVLWGTSLGTGIATEMAARGHGDALVLESPFTAIREVPAVILPHAIVAAFVPDRYDSLSKAPKVTMPVLIIHGTDDHVVPFAMGEHLSKVFPHAELLRIAGAGHNDMYEVAADRIVQAIARVARGD